MCLFYSFFAQKCSFFDILKTGKAPFGRKKKPFRGVVVLFGMGKKDFYGKKSSNR